MPSKITNLTAEQLRALDIARALAASGVPVFVARAATAEDAERWRKLGYVLPNRWEQTPADPAAIDRWQPGMALGAVMGQGLDLVDLDPRNGADMAETTGRMPHAYAVASTVSQGMHLFVRSLNVRTRDGVLPGVDVKAGAREPDAKGSHGRGFAFIAPTVRVSKVTGELAAYHWVVPPDLARLAQPLDEGEARAMAGLAELVGKARNGSGSSADGSGVPPTTPEQFMAGSRPPGPWDDVPGLLAQGRNHAVAKLAASLRGRGTLDLDEAVAIMDAKVWPLIDQDQGGHAFDRSEFETAIRAAWRQYPDGAAQRAQVLNASIVSSAPDTSRSVASGNQPPAENGQADQNGHKPAGKLFEVDESGAQRLALPANAVDLTDAYLADRVAAHAFDGRFLWSPGMGWLAWDGTRWATVDTAVVIETVRGWAINLLTAAAQASLDAEIVKRILLICQSATRLRTLATLACGVPTVHREAEDFDAHPDLLNTPAGIVDLRTGELRPFDPAAMLTKITKGNYRPGYRHPDWDQALTALPELERAWFQGRVGQAITGHPTPDGIMPVLQGGGENGKSALTTDGPVVALGDYAAVASPKLITTTKAGSSEHSTERADLRGQRLLIGEELSEGGQLDVTALKQIQDVSVIKARLIRRDNMQFHASHSLFVTTNYVPKVNQTDHGTWRRLALVRFPFTFLKQAAYDARTVTREADRLGDPGLKGRIRAGADGQHDAIVTWAVEGAARWYADPAGAMAVTTTIESDTTAWRTEADRVLGFWTECLEADRDACVGKTELTNAFNAWLRQNGHAEWSRETFAARFGEHQTTVAHGVEQRVVRNLDGLSRPPTWLGGGFGTTPGIQLRVWVGMRFRNDNDGRPASQESPDHPGGVSGVTGSPVKPYTGEPLETYQVTPSHPTQTPGISENLNMRTAPASDSTQTGGNPDNEVDIPAAGRLPSAVNRAGVVVPVDTAMAGTFLGRLTSVTVDVEHTGYPIGHRDYALRTVQLGDANIAIVLDPDDHDQRQLIMGTLAGATRLIAHSATADLVPLEHAGLLGLCESVDEVWSRMHDTVIPAKLSDPQSTGSDPDLKSLAGAVLGEEAVSPAADKARADAFKAGKWLTDTKATTPLAKSGWAQIDRTSPVMLTYAASDVLDTALLDQRLPVLPPDLLERERRVQAITARLAHRGLALDREHVDTLHTEWTANKRGSATVLGELWGINNGASSQQVVAVAGQLGMTLKRTKPSKTYPEGRASAAKGTLEPYANGFTGDETQQRFATDVLAHRTAVNRLGLFLDTYQAIASRGDGRVRPTIYTLAANTGRMSSVRPNLQQVPRDGGYRACIVADPGWTLVSADLSAVELRSAAALSGDPTLRAMIDAGVNVHLETAKQVFGTDVTKSDQRYYAIKRGVFGWLYGASDDGVTLAEHMGTTVPISRAMIESLSRQFPVLVDWCKQVAAAVRNGMSTFTAYNGRIIHLVSAHSAPNYCIQGTARELLVDAILRWDQTSYGAGRIVLPVHDEIVTMVPEADAQVATNTLVQCLSTELYGVPIVAEPSVPSVAWADSV